MDVIKKLVSRDSRTTRSAVLVCVFVALFATSDTARLRSSGPLDTEGLYYFDAGTRVLPDMSFVITRDGASIERQENDPYARTQPGFYVGRIRYTFVSYRVTRQSIAFQTESIAGASYSFSGRIGRENVESIKRVPFVTGTLITTIAGSSTRARERFVKAVVLSSIGEENAGPSKRAAQLAVAPEPAQLRLQHSSSIVAPAR